MAERNIDAADENYVEMSEDELGEVFGGHAAGTNAGCAMVEAETVM